MLFVINEELRNLAELFHKKKNSLYIVGGFVRNKLLGIPDYLNLDIDLCSAATPSDVEKILKNTEFSVEDINKTFGVIRIKGKEGIYEHATFRTEKYDFAGLHNPSNVEFIDSLETDSIRRDFRCNAVYYDIYKDEIIDPLGGVKDIKKRLIRTTRDPKIVFNDDSERILRMVRQASSLGFTIEKSTFESARANSFKVQYLTRTRIRHEFEKIITSDTFYPYLSNTKQAHKRGVQLLVELDVLRYILPTLSKISKLDIRDDMSRNLFNHIVEVFENCKESDLELRYAILMHDYGKAEALLQNKSFFGHENLTNSLIENELGDAGLMYSKQTIKNIKNIIHGIDFHPTIFDSKYKIRKFIINNILCINNIILIKNTF